MMIEIILHEVGETPTFDCRWWCCCCCAQQIPASIRHDITRTNIQITNRGHSTERISSVGITRGLEGSTPSSCIQPPILSSMLTLVAADPLVLLDQFPHCAYRRHATLKWAQCRYRREQGARSRLHWLLVATWSSGSVVGLDQRG